MNTALKTSTVAMPRDGWSIFFMWAAGVSALLMLFNSPDGLIYVIPAAAIVIFRMTIFDWWKQYLDPKRNRFKFLAIAAASVFSWAMLFMLSGFGALPAGRDANIFLQLLSLVFRLVAAVLFFGSFHRAFKMQLNAMENRHFDNLTQSELEKFPNAKGWTRPEDVLYRFNLPRGNFQPHHIDGIHIGNGIHWNEQGHMLTVGGAGQGKGTCLVLPALLSDGLVRAGISVVCLDPKGENAAVAAPHLRRAGYEVHIVNPFGIKEVANLGNSRWNPFDLVEDGEVKKFCDVLAFSLHNRRSNGDNDFFNNRCRQYISLYARYVLRVSNAKPKSPENSVSQFDQLYTLLKLSGENREALLGKMADDEGFAGRADAEAILGRLLSTSAKTEDSIYATIEEAIDILADDRLRRSLAASDFDLREIAQKPMAVFICVRHDELEYYATWLRMFTDALLKTLNRYYNPARKVLVLLDEFAQMGYVDQFAKAPAILRGYNVTLWPIVQFIGQLQDLYGREGFETFIGNSAIKQYFGGAGGTMDNTTANYIAHRLPKTVEIIYDDHGRPHGRENPLLDVPGVLAYQRIIGEVFKLSAPFEIEKVPYWKLNFAMNNASPNPFHK